MLWLQGQCYFADLRTSLSPAASPQPCTAFSGRVSWSAPNISFLRDLDMTQAAVEDRARLSMQSGTLIESGAVSHEGRLIPYVETWTRVAGHGGTRRVLDGFDRNGRLCMRFVEIDGLAIAMLDERDRGGGFAAAEFMWGRSGWSEVRHSGAVRIAPPPEVPIDADCEGCLAMPASSDAMWTSRKWYVRESSHAAIR